MLSQASSQLLCQNMLQSSEANTDVRWADHRENMGIYHSKTLKYEKFKNMQE